MKIDIALSSPPDREKLVAEIMVDRVQWAEINQEQGYASVEFYARPDGEPWRFKLSEAMEMLERAGKRLGI